MDSITQAVLGAAVADWLLGKKIGRKASLWGIFLGTLPDLDVAARPWLTNIEYLQWHRGWSHGVVSIFFGSLLTALLLKGIHRSKFSLSRAYAATLLIWFTHVLIDVCTVYGTGILEPFSQHWWELNLVFIIDPAFSLPLLAATILALLFSADRKWRCLFTKTALLLSTLYLLTSMFIKGRIDERFVGSLDSSDVRIEAWSSSPMPFNIFLWRGLVKTSRQGEAGFLIGYASIFDDEQHVNWRWVPQGEFKMSQFRSQDAVKAIDWFSKGFWIVRRESEGLVLSDLRFGELSAGREDWLDSPRPWIFNWVILEEGADFRSLPPKLPEDSELWSDLYRRVWGKRYRWEESFSPVLR